MKMFLIFPLILSFNLMANTLDLTFHNKSIKWTYKDLVEVFDQDIDHKNPNSKKFKQRYWYVSSYATNADAPVILDICGEATCNGPGPATMQAAKILGAHVFALEHRYYGKSFPVANLEAKNLIYLTIEQALLDLVMFKRAMQENLGLTGSWISIGGSYAGALSAYLKNQYPNDFVGALASSGPVKADLDFSEYDAHVAKVAGKDCQNSILKVVAEVEKNIESDEGFAEEKKFFGIKNLKLKEDFLYLLADTAAAAVQYGMKDEFCNLLKSEGKAGYAKGVALISSSLGDLESMSAQAAENTAIDPKQDVGMRQWLYQSCTEFGFWQNVNEDPSKRTRSKKINASYHDSICKRLFGIAASNVDKTNQKYLEPLLQANASNILFTNGEQDPWSNLSILETSNPQLATYLIKGAAHCDDLGGGGTAEVKVAKKLFYDLAKKWTAEPLLIGKID